MNRPEVCNCEQVERYKKVLWHVHVELRRIMSLPNVSRSGATRTLSSTVAEFLDAEEVLEKSA